MMYWVVAVLLAAFSWCLYTRFSYAGRCIAKIPGPKGIPLCGNGYRAILPNDQLFVFLRSLYKNFGGIAQLHVFHFRSVNIYDPEDVEDFRQLKNFPHSDWLGTPPSTCNIASWEHAPGFHNGKERPVSSNGSLMSILSTTRFNDKDVPYTFLKSWLNDGLLVSNGNKWQLRRKMLTPAFHFNILKKYTQSFTEHTEEFLQNIQGEVGREKTDLLPLITRTTLHIITETAMGISMGQGRTSIMESYLDALYLVGECIVKRMCRIWYATDVIYNMSTIGRTEAKALKDLHSLTDQVIRERKSYLENNNITEFRDTDEIYGRRGRLAMLDLLLENKKSQNIDMKGIREEVDTFMFEGHDTTAMALCFMIMRIANEPDIQENIHDEMQKIFGNSQRAPTMDDFNEMKYLECCIKESLRIYPSVPFIARILGEDTVLSGYEIPKNTGAFIHIYDIHHRADIYPEPEKFIPERFQPENSLKRHPYAYIPFSAGPRNCIGQKFAMLEMKTIVSGLLRKFKIEPVTKPEDIIFTSDLVLRTNHSIYVRFCERH